MTHYDLTVGIVLFDEIELTFTYQQGTFDEDVINRTRIDFFEAREFEITNRDNWNLWQKNQNESGLQKV